MLFKTLRDHAKRGSEITAELMKAKIAKIVQSDEGRLRIEVGIPSEQRKKLLWKLAYS